MLKKVSISELRRRLNQLCNKLRDNEDTDLVATKRNLPLVVVMSWKKYRGMRETISYLSALSGNELEKQAQRARDPKTKTYTSKELKRKLGLKD